MQQSIVTHSLTMNLENSTKVLVGAITGANGIKGYVRVKTFTDEPKDIFDFKTLCFEDGSPAKISHISSKKDLVIVSLDGVTDRNKAESMRNTQLFVNRSEFEPATEDTFYHADLIGLETRHSTGEKHGVILEVKNFGSCDILEIKLSDDSLISYPFKKPYVKSVNLEQKYVEVDPQHYESDE